MGADEWREWAGNVAEKNKITAVQRLRMEGGKARLLKFLRVTIRGAQASARLSEENCLSEGFLEASAGGLSEGSARLCGGPLDFLRFPRGDPQSSSSRPSQTGKLCASHSLHLTQRMISRRNRSKGLRSRRPATEWKKREIQKIGEKKGNAWRKFGKNRIFLFLACFPPWFLGFVLKYSVAGRCDRN